MKNVNGALKTLKDPEWVIKLVVYETFAWCKKTFTNRSITTGDN